MLYVRVSDVKVKSRDAKRSDVDIRSKLCAEVRKVFEYNESYDLALIIMSTEVWDIHEMYKKLLRSAGKIDTFMYKN